MTHNEDIERAGDELHSVDDTMTAAGDRKATKDKNNCERAIYTPVNQ